MPETDTEQPEETGAEALPHRISWELPLIVSVDMFCKWLFGRGKDRSFGNRTPISAKLRASVIMRSAIRRAIGQFEQKQAYENRTLAFTREEPDLWLSIRRCSYRLAIVKQHRVRKNGLAQVRYQVQVKIWDTYNFNIGNERGDGVGSFLNNLGYWLEKIHIGEDYRWEANYLYRTPWDSGIQGRR